MRWRTVKLSGILSMIGCRGFQVHKLWKANDNGSKTTKACEDAAEDDDATVVGIQVVSTVDAQLEKRSIPR